MDKVHKDSKIKASAWRNRTGNIIVKFADDTYLVVPALTRFHEIGRGGLKQKKIKHNCNRGRKSSLLQKASAARLHIYPRHVRTLSTSTV